MADNVVRLKPTRPCPICGRPSTQQFHPFCSARCEDIDLNRWLSGRYVIPAESVEDAADDTPADTAPSDPDDED
jgi:endogenous inhibitor of DNA gyrase (YacG/DUF329 family)